MNFDHLKYFVDASRARSCSAAAKENYVSQSAVSRAIRSLEAELEAELVVHRRNSFQLTEAGEAVLRESQRIFDSIGELREVAASYASTLKGPMRIACNQSIASHLLGPLLPQIEARYPEVKPEIALGNTDQVQTLVDSHTVDFGLVLNDGEVGKFYNLQDVFNDEFIVVRSPHLQTKRYDGSDLIVSRTKKGGMSHRYFAAYRKAYRRDLTPKLVVSSWQVIMDLAVAGVGSAFAPRFLCATPIREGKLIIVKHKVKPIPYKISTIVSKSRRLPKNADALLELLR